MHRKLTWRERLVNLLRNETRYDTCCYWCGGTWNWKEPHRLCSNDGTLGISPCCEECWKIMSLEQKIDALKRLYDNSWVVGSPNTIGDWIDVIKNEKNMTVKRR